MNMIEKYIADKITSLCEKRDISKYRLSQLSGISQSSSFLQSARPTLRYISPEFGLRSPDVFLVQSGVRGYNKISFLYNFKSYNKEIGKPDENLGRKATGPVKW